MRRLGLLVVLASLIVAGLVVSGVISVDVNVHPPSGADARPFWREKTGTGTLSDTLGIWVEISKAVRPAVVNISTTEKVRSPLGDDLLGRLLQGPARRPRTALGSGFIVSPDGYIVTNFHVVRERGANRRAPGRRAGARGEDGRWRRHDRPGPAQGRRRRPARSCPSAIRTASRSASRSWRVGNPFGLEQTVTTGIVSAKARVIGSGPYDDFIQTDASINPGNSGGPLVNARGEVVGINTAIFSQTGGWAGIGFAIPVSLAKQVLPQLRERGRVIRGYLGVSVGPVTLDVARETRLPAPKGALVAEVASGSPAARARIAPGDVIGSFQGEDVNTPRRSHPPGGRHTARHHREARDRPRWRAANRRSHAR